MGLNFLIFLKEKKIIYLTPLIRVLIKKKYNQYIILKRNHLFTQ